MTSTSIPEMLNARYRILRRLGEGGMATVYLAEDTKLQRRIALKVPHLDAQKNPLVIERFYREARMAARITHANFCRVYDVDEDGGIHYLTMDYIEGTPLSHYINPGHPWAVRQAIHLVRHLALALHTVHQQGIVHRDLKPSNVMIRKDGVPILMDFGLARPSEATEPPLTIADRPVGTPAYMSPEQVSGVAEKIGPASDIYSLGVMLFQLVTGQLPFNGSLMALFVQVTTAAPPVPSRLRPELDPAFDALCLQALAKDPDARPGSMLAFALLLQRYLESSPPTPAPTVVNPARRAPLQTQVGKRPGVDAATPPPPTAVPQQPVWVAPRTPTPGEPMWVAPASLPPRQPTPSNPALETPVVGKQPTLTGVPESSAEVASSPVSPASRWLSPLVPVLTMGLGIVFLGVLTASWPLVENALSPAQIDDPPPLPIPAPTPPAGTITLLPFAALTMQPGETRVTWVRVQRDNFNDAIALNYTGGSGLTVRLDGIPPGANRRLLTVQAPEDVPLAHHTLMVQATSFDGRVRSGLQTLSVEVGGAVLPRTLRNSLGMQFVLIPAGQFAMGSPEGEPGGEDEHPQHLVVQTRCYYLGMYEVTQREWELVMGKDRNRSWFAPNGPGGIGLQKIEHAQLPIENISYQEAVDFCARLSRLEGEKQAGRRYRLPFEAEWEYACRGGRSGRRHGFGSTLGATQANFGARLDRTTLIGATREANAFGLYDMQGNVWEWCADIYERDYYRQSPEEDPHGPTPQGQDARDRVARGGAWNSPEEDCRSARRLGFSPVHPHLHCGLRVVCELEKKP